MKYFEQIFKMTMKMDVPLKMVFFYQIVKCIYTKEFSLMCNSTDYITLGSKEKLV